MARRKKHEEHTNHEAWAIPYGDLVTLLFALFTVMYAMSSVNEGKFRVLSDSLIAAFHGAPKSIQPVNIGERQPGKGGEKPLVGLMPTALIKIKDQKAGADDDQSPRTEEAASTGPEQSQIPGALIRMERQVQDAMQALIDAKLVSVRRESMWLEIEINTDILFPSGAGDFSPQAAPVLDKLAEVLKPFPNPIRVEGHTDNRPIKTASFPSNWELSAARAASVVHEFTKAGIDPLRLEIVGFGEFHPRQSNATAEGRNANRRVAILVLEAVMPGTPVVTRAVQQPNPAGSSDVSIADADVADNRLLWRVPPADLGKTVLVKDQSKADAAKDSPPTQ
ncbi:MAG TPA: flagellar motor protein MotD [Steroidobacteraceae bacterium]|jgi:chemotaxis protein MotB|nr:flagellar motor protein MotD [Steroidobacteraceae bacterium]